VPAEQPRALAWPRGLFAGAKRQGGRVEPSVAARFACDQLSCGTLPLSASPLIPRETWASAGLVRLQPVRIVLTITPESA
jgi:hypothetical protein